MATAAPSHDVRDLALEYGVPVYAIRGEDNDTYFARGH